MLINTHWESDMKVHPPPEIGLVKLFTRPLFPEHHPAMELRVYPCALLFSGSDIECLI